VTPALDGVILPGVNRHSALELAREWNQFKVSERAITMKEVIQAVNESRVSKFVQLWKLNLFCRILLWSIGSFVLVELQELKQFKQKSSSSKVVFFFIPFEFQLLEMFGTATLRTICPVGLIHYMGVNYKIPTVEQKDPVYKKLFHSLTDICYGRVSHPWAVEID